MTVFAIHLPRPRPILFFFCPKLQHICSQKTTLSTFDTAAILQEARDYALGVNCTTQNGTPCRRAMAIGQQAPGMPLEGKLPYPWQLDAAETIVPGLECVVVVLRRLSHSLSFCQCLRMTLGTKMNFVIFALPVHAGQSGSKGFLISI